MNTELCLTPLLSRHGFNEKLLVRLVEKARESDFWKLRLAFVKEISSKNTLTHRQHNWLDMILSELELPWD